MTSCTSSNQSSKRRSWHQYLGLVASGFAMGSADVIPGVSGGTMAFILGIYEELVNSIRSVLNLNAIRLLLRLKIAQALDLLPWKFLIAVAGGIFLAIFSLAQFLEWMLLHHPTLIWSFFFGLVIASVVTVSGRIAKWRARHIAAVTIGAITSFVIFGLVPAQTPEAPWFLFLSGAVAICAMVLPGISGAFILVLLGKYQYVLSAVTSRDVITLMIFSAGALVGILSFAQVLGWLFKRYHDMTIAVLIGLMVGSLRKIWPWKETLSYIVDRHGKMIPTQEALALPSQFNTEVLLAMLLALAGFGLILALSRFASMKEKRTPLAGNTALVSE